MNYPKSFHCKGELRISGSNLRLKEDKDLLIRSFKDLYDGDLGYKKIFALIFASCLKRYSKDRLRNKLSGSYVGPLCLFWNGAPKAQEYQLKTTYYHPAGPRELFFEAKVDPTSMSYRPTPEGDLQVLQDMKFLHNPGQAMNTI